MSSERKVERVLFATYPRIGLADGGLQRQIESTAGALERLNIEVVRYSPWRNDLRGVDLVHFFSIDGSLLSHAELARRLSLPVVISPVFNGMGDGRLVQVVKGGLARRVPALWTDLRRASALLSIADRLVCLNKREVAYLRSTFAVPAHRCSIIPNGVSAPAPDIGAFVNEYGRQNFAVMVGTIEPAKNQLAALRVLARLKIPTVVIGAPAANALDYAAACRAVQGDILFTGQLRAESETLFAAYAAARLLIVPSLREVMPLVVLEAASMGCPLVLSSAVEPPPGIAPIAAPFNPRRPSSMLKVLREAWVRAEGAPRTPAPVPSWDCVARSLVEVYRAT